MFDNNNESTKRSLESDRYKSMFIRFSLENEGNSYFQLETIS